MPTGVCHSCFIFGKFQFWLSVLKTLTLQTSIACIIPCKNSLHITLIYVMASDFHIVSNSLFTISTLSHNTQISRRSKVFKQRKEFEKREEADKNNGTTSSSNQKCKVYKTFNIINIVLRHETKFSPGSPRRCFMCWGPACRDPYTPNPAHEVNCPDGLDFCVKADFFNGKCLYNRHLYII